MRPSIGALVDARRRTTIGTVGERWYSPGNQTVESDVQDLHLVDNWRFQLEPTFNLRLGSRLVCDPSDSRLAATNPQSRTA